MVGSTFSMPSPCLLFFFLSWMWLFYDKSHNTYMGSIDALARTFQNVVLKEFWTKHGFEIGRWSRGGAKKLLFTLSLKSLGWFDELKFSNSKGLPTLKSLLSSFSSLTRKATQKILLLIVVCLHNLPKST